VVVLQPDTSVTLEEIQAVAREHIAGYKIPRSLSFVDALPLSAQGKVLKRDLRLRSYEPVAAS
jgi:long-chain acyl-CoA synthetase